MQPPTEEPAPIPVLAVVDDILHNTAALQAMKNQREGRVRDLREARQVLTDYDSREISARRQLESMVRRNAKELAIEVTKDQQLEEEFVEPSTKRAYHAVSEDFRKAILNFHALHPEKSRVEISTDMMVPYPNTCKVIRSGRELQLKRGGFRESSKKYGDDVAVRVVELAMINSSWTIEKIREEYKIKYDSDPPVTAGLHTPSRSWISQILGDAKLTLKVARPIPAKRNTDPLCKDRREYAARMLVEGGYGDLVFIDETGFHASHRRAVARAFVGCEAFVDTPLERGSNITVIGAISGSGPECFVVKTGTTNQTVFRAFLERLKIAHAARPLRMVMDNAAFHKTQYVREAEQLPDVEIIYLPAYSPALNPIELAWSWMSRRMGELLSDTGSRTVVDELQLSIAEFALRPELCSHYVAHTRKVLGEVVEHSGTLLGDYVLPPMA